MRKKKPSGAGGWADPDDAPELNDAFFDAAEIKKGGEVVQRGRGRPKLENPKQLITMRLDADLVAAMRNSGPGWSTKANTTLRSRFLGAGKARKISSKAGSSPARSRSAR